MSVGKPAPVGSRELHVPHSFFRGADSRVRYDLHPRELAEVARSGEGQLWVDIDSTDRHQVALLEKIFNFHPLAIEDTLNPESRVKLEEYDSSYLFAIVRAVLFAEQTEDPYDLDTFNICFFLGRNYLVTVHGEPSRSIAAVAEQLSQNPELLERGAHRVMHAIMDRVIDHFFPIIDRPDRRVQP